MHSLPLTRRSRAVAIGPYIRGAERLRVRQVRIEGQQQGGAFLDDADPGVAVAVNAARVPFGLSKPAFQVEVVLWQVRLFPANKQPRSKAGHDVAKVLPGQVIALLELLLQDLKRCLTVGTRSLVRCERCLDRPDILHMGPNGFLGVLDRCEPPLDIGC
jgi:hypothetical protein